MKLGQLHGNKFSTKMQNLDEVIAKLSQERISLSPTRQGGATRRRDAVLLVSEAVNACVSLADLEKEEERTGKVDLHQCGRCKSMFNNMSKFISHKLQKECRRDDEVEETVWGFSNGGSDSNNRECSSPDASLEEMQEEAVVNKGEREHRKRSLRKGYTSRRLKRVNESYDGNGCYRDGGHVAHGVRIEEFSSNSYAHQIRQGLQESKHVDFDKQDFPQSLSNVDTVSHRVQSYPANFMPTAPRKHQGPTLEYQCTTYPEKHSVETNEKRERMPINLPQVMSTHGLPSRDKKIVNDEKLPGTRCIPPEHLLREISHSEAGKRGSKSLISISRPYSNPSTRESTGGDEECQVSRPYSASELTWSRRRAERDDGRPHHSDRITPDAPSQQPEGPSNEILKLSAKENTNVDGKKNVYCHTDIHPVNKHYRGQPLKGDNLTTTFDAGESETPSQVAQSSTDRPLLVTAEERHGSETETRLLHPPYQPDETTVVTEFDQLSVQDTEGSKDDMQQSDKGVPDAIITSRCSPRRLLSIQHVKTEKPDCDRDGPLLEEPAPEVSDVPKSYTPDKTNMILPTDPETPQHDHATSPLEGAPTFLDLSSSEKESNSPRYSNHGNDNEDFPVESQCQVPELDIPPHRRLTESMVERLITVPVSGGSDASWKHSKQMYSCPLCAKVFPFKSKLQRHVLVHTGIKPYKCTVCGRGFTQQIDLQRHLTRHTGEKPFKCHLCTAQFIRADNLKKHCKESHYISIEEPIRKRRRKTTGSDTVLPSLEVAIALAFSETERNGGRVLGRAASRQTNSTQENSKQKPISIKKHKSSRPSDIPPLERAPLPVKYSSLPSLQYQRGGGSTDSSRYSCNNFDMNGNHPRELPGKLGGCFPETNIDVRLPSHVDVRYGANNEENQYREDPNLSYARRRDDVMPNTSRYFSSSYPVGIHINNKGVPANNNNCSKQFYPPILIEGEHNQPRKRNYGKASMESNDDVFLRNDGDRYTRNSYITSPSGRQQRQPDQFKCPPGYSANFLSHGHTTGYSRAQSSVIGSDVGHRDANAHHLSHSVPLTEQPRLSAHEVDAGYDFDGEPTTPTVVPSQQESAQQKSSPLQQQEPTISRPSNEWGSSFVFRNAQNADYVLETDIENDIEWSTEDQKTVPKEEFQSDKKTPNAFDCNNNAEFSRVPNTGYSRVSNIYVDEEEIPIVTRSDDLPSL